MRAPDASGGDAYRRASATPHRLPIGRGFLKKAACASVQPQQLLHLLAQFWLTGQDSSR